MSATPPERDTNIVHNVRALLSWLPLLGGLGVGVIGVIVALNQPGSTAGGLYLLAAGVTFGLLANAVLRR